MTARIHPEPTQEQLREWFIYDTSSDRLVWKKNRTNTARAGTLAYIGVYRNGYNRMMFCGKYQLVHRLVWIYHNGPIDKGMEVDHKDRNKSNNAIWNLRLGTRSQNSMNTGKMKMRAASTNVIQSKWKGVYWCKKEKCWVVQGRRNGKRTTLGYTKDEVDAAQIYNFSVYLEGKDTAYFNQSTEENYLWI